MVLASGAPRRPSRPTRIPPRAPEAAEIASRVAPAARRGILVAVVAAVLAGCGASPGYLLHAGWSEARLLLRREPSPALAGQPGVDAALRHRLELRVAGREFARGPGLRVGDAYESFAEVPPDATVWVVSAARRDRLEGVEWRYPLVGRLPYRGFFDRG